MSDWSGIDKQSSDERMADWKPDDEQQVRWNEIRERMGVQALYVDPRLFHMAKEATNETP